MEKKEIEKENVVGRKRRHDDGFGLSKKRLHVDFFSPNSSEAKKSVISVMTDAMWMKAKEKAEAVRKRIPTPIEIDCDDSTNDEEQNRQEKRDEEIVFLGCFDGKEKVGSSSNPEPLRSKPTAPRLEPPPPRLVPAPSGLVIPLPRLARVFPHPEVLHRRPPPPPPPPLFSPSLRLSPPVQMPPPQLMLMPLFPSFQVPGPPPTLFGPFSMERPMLCRPQNPLYGLRPIVIDGCNVAFGYSKERRFEARGILLCVKYFISRGHRITVFVPEHRELRSSRLKLRSLLERKNNQFLNWMYKQNLLAYTPHRIVSFEGKFGQVHEKVVASYDDLFIVEYAHQMGGVIVSNDRYRDVQQKYPEWTFTIQNRVLTFTWVGETFMVPNDPMGRRGPTLEYFLHFDFCDGHLQNKLPPLSVEEGRKLIEEIDRLLVDDESCSGAIDQKNQRSCGETNAGSSTTLSGEVGEGITDLQETPAMQVSPVIDLCNSPFPVDLARSK